MFTQIALAFSSCITVANCESNLAIQNKDAFQLSSKPLTIAHSSFSNLEEIMVRKNSFVSYNNAPQSHSNYMTLSKTGETNSLNNPLYQLTLFVNGKPISNYFTVSGRNYTQNHDRHVPDINAPLPNGRYRISKNYIPGSHPEVGGKFLPIYPQFKTARSELGIHYDPSFDKSLKDDGTAGCIALTNRRELDLVLDYVRNYQPEFLEVQI